MHQVQDLDPPRPGAARAAARDRPDATEARGRWWRWTRAAFVAALLGLGLAGFTGSSGWYEATRDPLNGPELRGQDRNVFGRSRPIRSDEYVVELPVARAQQLARPAFPVVNVGLGLGELQRTPFSAPVLDWGLAFRPFTWPLLAGSRWSHGLRWFLRAALLALGLFAWLDVATGAPAPNGLEPRRSAVATLAALAIFFSSAVVWWLGHPTAQILAMSGLAVWAIQRQARAASAARRAAWLAAVAWLAAAAFFSFYPPIWAAFLWIVGGTALDVHRRARGTLRAALPGAAAALAAVAGGVALSIAYHAPYLYLVKDTAYPGRRVASAGDQPLGRLVELAWPSLHAYAPLDRVEAYVGSAASNVCEASAVEALPLFVLVALALVSARVRRAAGRAIASHPGLAAAWAVLAAWLFLPLPGAAGWVTLLRWTPGARAWVPFGLAAALLVAAILAELATAPSEGPPRLDWRGGVAAAAALGGLLLWARGELPGGDRPSWWAIELAAVLLLGAATLARTRWSGVALAAAWLLPVAATNVQVNPLLRAADLFHEEEAHALVRRALADRPGRILDLSTHSGSALAGHGWPVLAAVHMAPEESLWRFLAPATPGLGPELWNRFAHVSFVPPPFASRLPTADSLAAQIDPCNPRLAAIGVNHLLTWNDPWSRPRCSDYEARPVGELLLWSRRVPVQPVGVAHGERPTSALDFDWTAGSRARVTPGRDRLVFEAPGERGVHYAFPFNLGLIDEISCEGASATTLDTHVVVSPTGGTLARCEVRFLGTAGVLRRLLARGRAE